MLSVEVVEAVPGVLVLQPRGDIDLSTAWVLDDALDAALASTAHGVILDRDAVAFLAAAGVRALVDARTTAYRRSIGFRLAGGSSFVLRVLGVVHLRRPVAALRVRRSCARRDRVAGSDALSEACGAAGGFEPAVGGHAPEMRRSSLCGRGGAAPSSWRREGESRMGVDRAHPAVTASFDTSPGVAQQARITAARAASAWGVDGDSVRDLLIVVTELVSNAVEHARTPSTLALHLHGSVVHVAVSDASTALPVVRPFDPRAARGRGMQMVEAVSARWGHRTTTRGKTVWAEVPVVLV
ncbi:STAS domain-containing protein [Pseudonocardia broussonetiae]|uniref:STAS domain-containing protein n=1 Tax=Pseudonocardia broussonetiae TaxID=2736640 RepID=A0A6M6JS37_9PSEU|nr:STAS domain-containing protein [Pseudonocardia broussonetiae]QJY49051.1 STAS domain-containing protein [Pseudonocardia broussonetiae]